MSFGYPGAMNDINIMDCSDMFTDVRAGKWPLFYPTYTIANRTIDWFYWVTDGIYPNFRIFLKTISNPKNKKEKLYSKCQEAFRKSAERVYAVLFSRWHILSNPSRIWRNEEMNYVVKACIILHNMIIEAKDNDMQNAFGTKNIASIDKDAEVIPIRTRTIPTNFYDHADYLRETADLVEDTNDHRMLQNAVMDKIWYNYGGDLDSIEVTISNEKLDEELTEYDTDSSEDH